VAPLRIHDRLNEPVLDTENGMDWRTAEYWRPQNAHYLLAVSMLEAPAKA
jgi:hypothetical protein